MTTLEHPVRRFTAFIVALGLLSQGVCQDQAPPMPAPFSSDGVRGTVDLTGTWEARPGIPIALTWPPPVDGWKPQVVPHRDITPLISSDEVGPYFAHNPDKIVDSQGAPLSKQAAVWLRRSFTLAGPIPPGMRVRLCLDGVAFKHVAMLNDRKLGESVLALAPHVYDVTAGIKSGENRLAIGITNRAGLWDQEHKTYIAPIAGTMAGIYGAVRLELVPETLIADVFVRTSVAKKRLEVDLELSNASNRPRTVQGEIAIRDPMGTVQLTLLGQPVELAPGTLRTVTVGADWLARHLWGLSQPHLYRAEVRLLENGAERDRTAVTFGYREFAAKGIDFTLNGRRQVLLRNSWLRGDGDDGDGSRIDWMLGFVNDETRNYNCVRMHLGFNNPHVIDQADRSGLMLIPEFWGFYVTNDKAMPIAQAQFWVPNTAETQRRIVRRYRNHPSIIMWSTGNEMMWDSIVPAKMAVCDVLVKNLRATDPTRLLQGDAEVTWDGRLDAINIHYPEIESGSVSARYPLSGRVIPNDFDWLKPPGERSVAWRADFTWDRPLMFGEFSAPEEELDRHTSYAGDTVYDSTTWRWRDFDGRGKAAASPWLDMVKMSCDHYRAAGVACLNPWTGFGDQLMPRFLVAPLDHHPSAFSGENFLRRIVVANDTHQMYFYGNLFVQAGLLIEGREVWSERITGAHCGPGEKKTLVVTVKIPVVERPQRARLILRLNWMIGPNPRELHRHEEDLWIHPRPSLVGLNAGQVALLDGVEGATAKALEGLGMLVNPGPVDDAALGGGKRLLVIGEGAAKTADLAAAARFVERGGRVLMLHQTELPSFVPHQPQIDARHAASSSWRHAEHPALAGLEDGQLRFWRPDHLVATETYVRPSAGPGLGAATCGGRYGMHWSPLIELRHGKGAVTFCQYLLVGRTTVEPAAAIILSQAIRAALAAVPIEPDPALRVLMPSPETAALLAAAHIATTNDLTGAGPALVHASTPPSPDTLKRLRAEVEAGRTLWLRGLNGQTLPAIQGLLPWKPGFAPLPKDTIGAVRRSGHRLIAGISTADLFWARGEHPVATLPLGGPVIVPPALDAAVLLTEPALLVAVPLGKGWVLIDQLALDQALVIETERALRIASCLARNAGAGFTFPEDAFRHYRFTGLDLAKYANRDYIDHKAGDEVGGWTDQGDNDLRYFLINHAGLVGAGVANEPFPTHMAFNGVEYRLVDPKANQGKAVLVLRGGVNDRAAPAGVTGIPAGGAKADRVWFLHTGAWPSDGGHGTEIARYEIVYADGTRAVAPVRQGQHISDWWQPKPMPGAQVAWTGRNARSNVVVVYSMAWNNPHPDKPIASIDVIGSLAQTQLVLLAITLGVDERASSGARPVASWELGQFTDGRVEAEAGGAALVGTGTPVLLGQRTGLRVSGGQHLSCTLAKTNPIVTGTPLAIEIELAPEGKPGGYCGGLVSAGNYQIHGLRLTLGGDLRVCAEQWTGEGAAKAVYLKTREPLPIGRFSTLRYEHNGTEARLLVDGQVQAILPCAPPAPYVDRGLTIGRTGGKDYWFNGVIGGVRIFSLAPASGK